VPLAVLVNKASASASEVVAGALQDHRRALIVGERSYGKGSVQAPFELGDGSVLKLTISLYYTPADRLIQASGILPDVLVGTELAAYKDSIPELEPERAQPRHLRPEAFGYPPSTQNAEGEALSAAGSDAQLRAAVQHLRSHIHLQSREAPRMLGRNSRRG
jgi:carboxyl-terminal processing protease